MGARVLENGDNAMDAASAASMACCMLQLQRHALRQNAPYSPTNSMTRLYCSKLMLSGTEWSEW